MCGIFGFLDTNGGDRQGMQAASRSMAAALRHRGPDDSGVWQDPDTPLLLGQTRLSIIDLSPEGHQPMESHSGRYIVTFNGEIYNFPELRRELEEAGETFRGRSDTEIMLAAFDRWGVNRALQKLNGMFAFALWDRKDRVLHFARDRLGKKPLYVGWAGRSLVFASELKAFRSLPAFTPEIDRGALTLYMRYACVPAPHCIYRNVWQLLPGTRLMLRAGELKPGANLSAAMERYWSPPRIVDEARQRAKQRKSPLSEQEAIAEFSALLGLCVKQRMISDVPLGAFLSGGIDSSTIVALMREHSGQPVKTFTIGFGESGFDEAKHAAKIAQHLGTDHHELYLTPQDALAVIPQLPDIYDEPFADASQIPTYMVSRFARRHVTVALSGDGGDELLGGYSRHVILPHIWRRFGWLPLPARKMLRSMLTALPAHALTRLVPGQPHFGEKLHKMAGLLAMSDMNEMYASLAGLWPQPEKLVTGGHEPLIPVRDPAFQPSGLSLAERLVYNDTVNYLPNDILTKVDRASMAASLEARAPLLDSRLFEYVWSLPLSMKIRDGQGKWLLRQVLKRHIPPALFDRPKQGFSVPVGPWLQGPLKDWAEDLLSEDSLKSDGFLNVPAIRAAWRDHGQNRGNHAHRLWTVLMFQSWRRRWGVA